MNIAWRYRNVSATGVSVVKSKYAFDLSKQGDKEKAAKACKAVKAVPGQPLMKLWDSLTKGIQSVLTSPSDDRIFRVLLPSFLGPQAYFVFCQNNW